MLFEECRDVFADIIIDAETDKIALNLGGEINDLTTMIDGNIELLTTVFKLKEMENFELYLKKHHKFPKELKLLKKIDSNYERFCKCIDISNNASCEIGDILSKYFDYRVIIQEGELDGTLNY